MTPELKAELKEPAEALWKRWLEYEGEEPRIITDKQRVAALACLRAAPLLRDAMAAIEEYCVDQKTHDKLFARYRLLTGASHD